MEFRTAPLKPARAWRRVVSEMATQRAGFVRCQTAPRACSTPVLKSWRRLVEAVEGRDAWERLKIVNRFFNRWRHRDDIANNGAAEHWASPAEFMANSGDCEDYAVAKLFALRLLGFASRDLRIVVVTDTTRGAGHAVLSVRLGGDILVLDNLGDRVLSHRAFAHYIPRYSLSETASWAHIPARGPEIAGRAG